MPTNSIVRSSRREIMSHSRFPISVSSSKHRWPIPNFQRDQLIRFPLRITLRYTFGSVHMDHTRESMESCCQLFLCIFLSSFSVVQDCPDAGTNWRGSWDQACQSCVTRGHLSDHLCMLTSQILQLLGGDAASASNWEPQAVHIASSLLGILLFLE